MSVKLRKKCQVRLVLSPKRLILLKSRLAIFLTRIDALEFRTPSQPRVSRRTG